MVGFLNSSKDPVTNDIIQGRVIPGCRLHWKFSVMSFCLGKRRMGIWTIYFYFMMREKQNWDYDRVFYCHMASIKWGWPSFSRLLVSTSQPVSVTSKVCSNWADLLPSWVTAVQLSGQVWSRHVPAIRRTKRQISLRPEVKHLLPKKQNKTPTHQRHFTLRNHWFYSESMSRFHYSYSLVFWNKVAEHFSALIKLFQQIIDCHHGASLPPEFPNFLSPDAQYSTSAFPSKAFLGCYIVPQDYP